MPYSGNVWGGGGYQENCLLSLSLLLALLGFGGIRNGTGNWDLIPPLSIDPHGCHVALGMRVNN